MKRRFRVLGVSGAMAAAVALFFVGGLWFAQPAEAQKAAEVLAKGAEAVPEPSTVHLTAKVRIPPGDWFESIDADQELVPVQVWRQFGDRPRCRLEKSDMIEVMDDTAVTLFAPPHRAWKQQPVNNERMDNYPLTLLQLARVRDMLDSELRDAIAKGWDLKLSHETTPGGQKQLLVTVEAKTKWPMGSFGRDTGFDSSDMRRVYRFDAATQQLVGLDFYLHRPAGDVLVLTLEQIEYGKPIEPALFTLTLPEDVDVVDYRNLKKLEPLPDNETYEKMTPKEAAQAFFEACAKEDWAEVEKFSIMPPTASFRKDYGGLQIIRIGEPFRVEGTYKGWFIPFEIKLTTGEIKKWNLAMYKHRNAKRYIEDGGL